MTPPKALKNRRGRDETEEALALIQNQGAFLDAVRRGHQVAEAAALVGWTVWQANQRLNRGAEDASAGVASPEAGFYLEFARAEAQNAGGLIDAIAESARDDWRAGAYLLERRHKVWAANPPPVQVVVQTQTKALEKLPLEDLLALEQILNKAQDESEDKDGDEP
jgi:hypothetical protein